MADAARVRLLAPGRRPLTIGLVLVITAIAFEALAVSTALPVVSRELNGVRLYGWAFSGFMLANLLGITLGGPLADRVGPAPPMLVGLILFGTGLVVSGLAPTMLMVVVGRFVAGAGSGAVFSTAYVLIGIGYPEHARARLFAVASSAWVVPSLIGPVLAGTVAEHLGWRWVFLGLVPLMALDAALVLPATRSIAATAVTGDTAGRQHPPLPVADAVRLVVGAAVMVAGFGASTPLLGAPMAVGGFALAVVPFRRLVPEGTLRAANALGAAIAMRGLLSFAFFTFDGFMPLTLTSLRGVRPSLAGLTLTAGGLSWTTGSWVAERRGALWGRRRTTSLGAASLVVGMSTAAVVLIRSVPVIVAPLGWLFAGLGMGLCFPTQSVIVLEEAAEGRVGKAASALQLTDVLGTAVGTGLAGALVAFTVTHGWGRRPGIIAADAMTIAAALLALAVSRRLPSRGPSTRPSRSGRFGPVRPVRRGLVRPGHFRSGAQSGPESAEIDTRGRS